MTAPFLDAFNLSPREKDIAAGIAKGKCPKAIARELGMTYGTVHSRLRMIFTKCGVTRQSALAVVMILGELPK